MAALLATAASVHYANEYADHRTDALTDRTPVSGGSEALQTSGLGCSVLLRAGEAGLLVGGMVTVGLVVTGLLDGLAGVLWLSSRSSAGSTPPARCGSRGGG